MAKEKKQDEKNRAWLTEVYPESEVEGWREKLSYLGLNAVISPLHQFDKTQTGETKKAHYHVMLLWDGPTTYSNAKKYVDMIGGVGCLKCATIRGSVRYFCHLDNPEKHLYDTKDINVIGGLDINEILLSDSDETLILKDMYNFIYQYRIDSYQEFINYCSLNEPDWFHLVSHKFRENIWKYIRSIEYDIKRGRLNEYGEEDQQGSAESKQEVSAEDGEG